MDTHAGGISPRGNRVGCFAEDDLRANGQRSEYVLLRAAEERKIVM